MTREPPPLRIGLPIGALAGAAMGVIGASLYLTLALSFDLQAFDMLLVTRLTEIEREVYAEEMRLAYAGIAGAAVLGAAIAAAATFKRRLTTYGDAHWQSTAEMKANGMIGKPGTGFVCAKLGPPASKAPYVTSTSAPHVMMIAPTRAGKGVGFVIPNLLAFEGSAIALDLKGELHEATARWRGREHRPVFRFAPYDWEAETHRYNPLARVAAIEEPDRRHAEVRLLADRLLDRGPRTGTDTFDKAGRQIFTAACKLAIQRRTPTLAAVADLVMGGESNTRQFRGYAEEAGRAGDEASRLIWLQQSKTSERTLSSNVQALMTGGLDAWTDPAVRRATAASDFDFASFRRTRQTLYLGVSEDHVATLAPVMRLMFAELIAALRHHLPGRDEPHAVMVMMDEFQQMGPMPFVEETIHSVAGYGGRFAIIAQSLAALDELYGPSKRRSLEAGCGLRLFITPRDEDTVGELSRAVGSCTAEAVTRSYGRRRGLGALHGQSVREEERPLLSETQARTMDAGEVVVLTPPQMPIRARRIVYHEDPTFTAITEAQEAYPWPTTRADGEKPAPRVAARAEPEMNDGGKAGRPATEASAETSATTGSRSEVSSPEPADEGPGTERHGLRIEPDTPRETPLPAELLEVIRRLEARIVELTAELSALRETQAAQELRFAPSPSASSRPREVDEEEAPALEADGSAPTEDEQQPSKLVRLRRKSIPKPNLASPALASRDRTRKPGTRDDRSQHEDDRRG